MITSGTPAFPYALSFAGFQKLDRAVHRISPGTVVFHDTFTDDLMDDVDLQPAALLFTRVISRPRDGRVTCDAGSKSIAAEAGDPCAVVLGHADLEARTPSEEHLPLEFKGEDGPVIGQELLLIPRHVCPTVNLAEEVVLIDGGLVVEVAPVVARAHDVLATR